MSEPTKPRDEGRSVPVGIGTGILLFGFILQFFSVRQSLPIEIQIVSAIFAGASAILFVVWAWYSPMAHYWAERRSTGREDKISLESVETFKSHIERLQEFANGRRMDTLIRPLANLKGQPEFGRMPDFYPWLTHVDSLCTQLLGSLSLRGLNRSTFIWAVDTFGLVVNLFNDNLNRIVNEARLIAEQKPVPKAHREDYNTYRQTYNRFLDDYSAFVAGLNKRFRSYEREVTLPGNAGATTFTEYAFRQFYAERPKEL